MPPFDPLKRRDLIRYLQQLGFTGPFSRGKHQHMKRGDLTLIIPNPHQGDLTLIIPNPHQGDISRDLLARILRQSGISRAEWESL